MSVAQVDQKTVCKHCGDRCPETPITDGVHPFCCEGCKAVHHLLSDSGLGTYYDIEQTPGISMRKSTSNKKFDYLDDEDVTRQLIEFNDGKIAKVSFTTPQIHCSSCIWLLENLHRLNDAILGSEVFFGRKEVTISFDPQRIKLSEVAALLAKIGYDPDLTLGKLDKSSEKEKNPNTSLYLKIGIAGFSFGNIMLFSIPEYLSGAEGVDQQFIHLFGWLNVALALPVFLYSSTDFFRPALLGIRQRMWNMDIAISLGIIAMFGRSVYEIALGYGVGYMDSFAMLVFLLLVGRLFQKKTFETLSFDRDYRSYFPLHVIKLVKGEEIPVTATRLEVGDKIMIRNGELVPADSILNASEAHIDYSFVTGESEPVKVNEGTLVYAGGRLNGPAVTFSVSKPVSRSYLTRLWNHESFRKDSRETLRDISQRFSRYFSPAVLTIAFLSAIFWFPSSPATAVNAFTAVLIIACPCALALSAPFTLGWSTTILGRNRYYLKNADVTERLASADTIVFDKTGTLTESERAEVKFTGDSLNEDERFAIASAIHNSTHPLSRKIWNSLADQYQYTADISDYQEIPGKGLSCTAKGIEVKAGSAAWVGADAGDLPENNPERSQVWISLNGVPRGYFEIRSAFRSGLSGLFEGIRDSMQLHLISGDSDREQNRLVPFFGSDADLRFRQSPEDKLKFIEKLKKEGKNVMMLGDGLNDAGALRESHVGISISENTGSFTPASDVIMEASGLSKLDKVIRFSKKSMTIIKISFAISVLYNVIGLGYAVTGTLSPLICAIIMPISSITVIAFTTLGTHMSAKKLGLKAWK